MSRVQSPLVTPFFKQCRSLKIIFRILILSIFFSLNFGCSHPRPKVQNELKKENSSSKPSFILPSPEKQKAIVVRLDGEGLIPRKSRPEPFKKTIDKIANEAIRNQTMFDFYRTFSRLDATYPNIHANVSFNSDFDPEFADLGHRNMDEANVNLSTEVLTPSKTKTVIGSIVGDSEMSKKWEGAELIAINGIPLKKWQDENFIYCKWALRSICDRMLEENILKGILFWKTGPLVYSVKNGRAKKNIAVQFKKTESGSNHAFERRQCDWKWKKRYPGFDLIHKGYFACLFQKVDDASTLLLRISSFQYKRGHRVDPKSPIQTMKQETDALKSVWIPRSASVKQLILDLIDNGGGNEPMDYYRMLFHKPFFEQYVEFKKTPEIEDDQLRNSMFWEEKGHELWFQKQKKDGNWNALKIGQFSKPTPMFCADDSHSCGDVAFYPFEHQFNGKISVMLNDGCVSSCDGVAWMLATRLNAKLYGFYQAADTAYSRLRIDIIRDESKSDGFKLNISPQRANSPTDLIISQDVAVTLSVDENGKVLSGYPLPLKKFVPIRWDGDYHQDVLKAVLNDKS